MEKSLAHRDVLFRHLQDLTRERNWYKVQIKNGKLSAYVRIKSRLMGQLTKEYKNSFYGKTD
jgi:hypothetical protein